MRKTILLLISIFAFHTEVHALCGLSLSTSNVTVNWVPTFTYIAVPVTVNKSGPDACDFGIGFSRGGAASYVTRRGLSGANDLLYQLYKASDLSNILKEVPDITSANDVVTGGFAGGTNMVQSVNYYFHIPYNASSGAALIPAGTYTDTYTLNIYEGSDPTLFVTPEGSPTAVTTTVNVPTLIAISIVNPGGGFVEGQTMQNMNMGSLYEGETVSLDLRVRSNAGFDVTFSSLNNGNMKHATANSLVPYKFYVNGSMLDMSNSATVPVSGLTRSGQTALTGLAYPIKVVIGNVTSGKLSGSHADTITVTATTTE